MNSVARYYVCDPSVSPQEIIEDTLTGLEDEDVCKGFEWCSDVEKARFQKKILEERYKKKYVIYKLMVSASFELVE